NAGFGDDGEALYEAALEQKLEGVMAKPRGSRYAEGKRTRDWLKVKTHGRQEFVVCGWTKGQGRRAGSFGSLVLGAYRGSELVWVGNCGTGFTERDIDELLAKLQPLRTDTPPLEEVPKMPKVRKGDLLDYYRAVAPVLLPHLRDRPFTMRRYPDGALGKAFFQKDAPSHMPDWIRRFRVEVSTRESPRRRKWIEAPLVNDEDALLW